MLENLDIASLLITLTESDAIKIAWEGFAFIIIDSTGKIVIASPTADELFGYRSGELSTKCNIDDLIPEQYKKHHPNYRKSYFEGSTTRPMALGKGVDGVKKNGTTIKVSVSLYSKFVRNVQYSIACISLLDEAKAESCPYS